MPKKKILVIMGHPDSESLNAAIAKEYISTAEKFGADIKFIDLRKLKFDPILHYGYRKKQRLEPDLKKAQEDILWADHLVFIYPTWWGGFPALLKGFIDRTLLPGFAFKFHKGSELLPEQLLKRKSGRIITTTGGPSWLYRIIPHPGILSAKLFTLYFCGISPTRVTLFGKIRKISKERAKKIFEKVRRVARIDVG